MRLTSLVRRRPSPAMLVSLVALFMSLGGVGYAATQLPSNSVGTPQLKSNAVTFGKITPGAVGTVRANLNQLQARISATCSTGTAVGVVDQSGKVTCNAARPSEFGTTNNSATITATPVSVTTVNLPAGASYLALANPTATVVGDGTDNQRVTVGCTLTVGSNTETRNTTINTGTSTTPVAASIPLQVAGPAGTATVSCAASVATGTLPATSVTAAINALQTASDS